MWEWKDHKKKWMSVFSQATHQNQNPLEQICRIENVLYVHSAFVKDKLLETERTNQYTLKSSHFCFLLPPIKVFSWFLLCSVLFFLSTNVLQILSAIYQYDRFLSSYLVFLTIFACSFVSSAFTIWVLFKVSWKKTVLTPEQTHLELQPKM